MKKQIGFIGLGKMGFPMVERLLKTSNVVAYNRSPEKVLAIAKKGAIPAYTIEELIFKLKNSNKIKNSNKKIIWLMLPADKTTTVIKKLLLLLDRGDILINGANDFYKNAEKHSRLCRKYGVYFFDCGVSGGVWGLKNGYTLMIGGPKNQFKYIEGFCKALAPKNGYAYFGNTGAGHFVKSIHNIVEYIYLEGLAEGAELLSKFEQPINIEKTISTWRPASVIRSWLLDLADTALKRQDFNKISPQIGSVTIKELKKTLKSVKGYAPAFNAAVKIREDKSKKLILGKRLIAAIRREFGGHTVSKNNDN